MASFTEVFGDGSDGAYTGGALVKGQTYQFTTFDLNAPITLGAGDGNKVVIKCTGSFTMGPSANITSGGTDSTTKDSTTVTINGNNYSCASVDGAGGTGGTWGDGEAGAANGGVGGYNGGNGTAGGFYCDDPAYCSVGGAGGTYPGGNGGDGVSNGRYNTYAGGGGGGGAGGGGSFQNGIIVFAYGAVTLAGSVSGSATASGYITGGAGGAGSAAPQGGGGGGGGGGAGGTGGMNVRIYYFDTSTGSVSITANGATGGPGGVGGAGSPSGTDGGPGGTGTTGTAGTFTSTQLDEMIVGDTTISNIFAFQAQADSSVLSDGGATITERGFVFSEFPDPTI